MKIKPGIYKHYKGRNYQVEDIATHSETEEKLVVYRPLYGDQALFVRPLNMFSEYIEIEGKQVQRFEFVSEI